MWGKGVPEPTFFISEIHIKGVDIRVLGKNRTTISFTHYGVKFIKFNCSHKWIDDNYIGVDCNLTIKAVGTLGMNYFNGKSDYQFVIDRMEVDNQEMLF